MLRNRRKVSCCPCIVATKVVTRVLLLLQGAELDEAAVQGLVREFAASWKNGIEAINQDVLTFFSNARNAMEILKQVGVRLHFNLQIYYH